jgi:hypothetical protein
MLNSFWPFSKVLNSVGHFQKTLSSFGLFPEVLDSILVLQSTQLDFSKNTQFIRTFPKILYSELVCTKYSIQLDISKKHRVHLDFFPEVLDSILVFTKYSIGCFQNTQFIRIFPKILYSELICTKYSIQLDISKNAQFIWALPKILNSELVFQSTQFNWTYHIQKNRDISLSTESKNFQKKNTQFTWTFPEILKIAAGAI